MSSSHCPTGLWVWMNTAFPNIVGNGSTKCFRVASQESQALQPDPGYSSPDWARSVKAAPCPGPTHIPCLITTTPLAPFSLCHPHLAKTQPHQSEPSPPLHPCNWSKTHTPAPCSVILKSWSRISREPSCCPAFILCLPGPLTVLLVSVTNSYPLLSPCPYSPSAEALPSHPVLEE